jgi:uncharacterized protein YuzB (UPF0349 family)
MNERIRELEIEAIAYADSKVPANSRYNDIYHSIVRGKFAELMVEEVYDYILNATFDDEPWPSRKDVKQHFGVEQ